MPKKQASKGAFTHPELPGKTYKTERGLNQALKYKREQEAQKSDTTVPDEPDVTLTLSGPAQAYLRDSVATPPENAGYADERDDDDRPVISITEPVVQFVRNRYHTEVSLRFDRHDKRRIELKPRGQRGDFAPIQPADLNDPVLIQNVNLGLVELITAGEAAEIAGKQTTNQQAVHPALAVLRNELGEEYDQDSIKVEIPFEEQGVVVAELEDGNVIVDRTGIRRKRARGQEPGTPDYIAGAENVHAPAGEEAAYLSDLQARQKQLEGPAAAGIQRVTVEPTRTT